MWPKESQYPTNSHSRDIPYDPSVREFSNTNTFGSRPHSKRSLKGKLNEKGIRPLSPLISSRPCSKSQSRLHHSHDHSIVHASSLSSLSALQSTLMQCGRLNVIESVADAKKMVLVEESDRVHRKYMKAHAESLTAKGKAFRAEGSVSEADASPGNSGNKAPPASSIFKENSGIPAQNRKGVPSFSSSMPLKQPAAAGAAAGIGKHPNNAIPQTGRSHLSVATARSQVTATSTAAGSLASSSQQTSSQQAMKALNSALIDSLKVETTMNSENPYRNDRGLIVTHVRCKPRVVRELDPLDYNDEMFVKTMGHFNACIGPDRKVGTVPRKSEVNNILIKLTRTTIRIYNTRIVETGALLKAMKDPRHATPGLEAIFQLHRKFIVAATMNPNQWLLSKAQAIAIIADDIPWIARESITRLVLSFDPQNTGLIRYVRISTTLLCCLQPAMIDLAATLNRVRNKVYLKKETVAEEFRTATGSTVDMSNLLAEMITISLMHRLYEECGGGTERKPVAGQKNPIFTAEYTGILKNGSTDVEEMRMEERGVGMKFEDLTEAFSCCVNNIDDELHMEEIMKPLIQWLFDATTKNEFLAGNYRRHESNSSSGDGGEEETFAAGAGGTAYSHGGTAAASHGNDPSTANSIALSRMRLYNERYKAGKTLLPDADELLLEGIRDENFSRVSSVLCRKSKRHRQSAGVAGGTAGDGLLHLGGNSMAWEEESSQGPSLLQSTKGASKSRIAMSERSNNYHASAAPGASAHQHGNNNNISSSGSVGQQGERIDVNVMLRNNNLKILRQLPRISQEQLLDAVKANPTFLIEFIRQVRAFRKAAQKYIFYGSQSIDDSIHQFSTTSS